MDIEIVAVIDGVTSEVTAVEVGGNCRRVDFFQCDQSVEVQVRSGDTYVGKAVCELEPDPMMIAMKAQTRRIAANFFGSIPTNLAGGFSPDLLVAEIAQADTLIANLPDTARSANQRLYTALSVGDYAEAQRQANEVSSHLRLAGEERASLAYSSITYMAGFHAIGLDSLDSQNPLVATIGNDTSPFVVLSPAGRDVLAAYQKSRDIQSAAGVWDFDTTSTVADIIRTEDVSVGFEPPSITGPNSGVAAVPTLGLGQGDFIIDGSGRMIFR